MFGLSCLEPINIGNGLLRLGSGGKQRARICFHHGQEVINVTRVIGVRLSGETEPGADKRRKKFRTRLFKAIGIVAKAFAEVARQTARGT